MKPYKRHLIFLTAVVLALSLLCCNTEELELKPQGLDISFRSEVGSDLVEVKYDIDYTMITESGEEVSSLDRAAMTPIASKERVRMIIRDNGAVRLETERMPSKNAFTVNHSTLPNDLPEVAKTILDNDQMELYDGEGKLIRTVSGQSIKMPYLAEQLRQSLEKESAPDLGSLLACIKSNVKMDSLNAMIKNPPAHVQVHKLNENIVTLRMPAPVELRATEAHEVVNIVDRSNKLLLASRLYGKNSEVLQCMMYRYDECSNLKGFKQEVQTVLPSGKSASLVTYAEIDNLEIVQL